LCSIIHFRLVFMPKPHVRVFKDSITWVGTTCILPTLQNRSADENLKSRPRSAVQPSLPILADYPLQSCLHATTSILSPRLVFRRISFHLKPGFFANFHFSLLSFLIWKLLFYRAQVFIDFITSFTDVSALFEDSNCIKLI